MTGARGGQILIIPVSPPMPREPASRNDFRPPGTGEAKAAAQFKRLAIDGHEITSISPWRRRRVFTAPGARPESGPAPPQVEIAPRTSTEAGPTSRSRRARARQIHSPSRERAAESLFIVGR